MFLLDLGFSLGVAGPLDLAFLLGVVLARPLGVARLSGVAGPLALAFLLGAVRFSGVARLPKSFAWWGRSV